MTIIITALILAWIGSAVVRNQERKRNEQRYRSTRQIQTRQGNEIAQMMAESKAETERLIALEKARIEQEKWNLKQEEINRKNEERLLKVEAEVLKYQYVLEQAEEDIVQCQNKINQLDEYGKYLELERDACVYGSANWHKWNNKFEANNNKVYTIQKQMNKASYNARNAELKLKGVA